MLIAEGTGDRKGMKRGQLNSVKLKNDLFHLNIIIRYCSINTNWQRARHELKGTNTVEESIVVTEAIGAGSRRMARRAANRGQRWWLVGLV
jgi:hypothetical protein